jgi:hypothetical protein
MNNNTLKIVLPLTACFATNGIKIVDCDTGHDTYWG